MKNNFPSIDTVHETLSDLTKLFEDRNAILNSMFREDKYKDFLLAENIQSLVEADKRDDASGGKIKKDLANGYEILKAKTNMQKFASFISPGMLPTLDLSEKGDYDDDGLDYENDMYDKEGGSEESSTPEKGEKGDKGDTGDVNVNMDAPKSGGFNNRLTNPSGSQNSGLKLAEGGVVPPSPMMNAMNPSAQRPETKSGVKSLESLGLVGKKNVASELTEDLGLEEYKKALADAMALPLKAVAAGLAGLMDNIDVPGGEGAAIGAQTNSIAKAFDVTPSKKKKEKEDKGNPLLGIAKMLLPFGMGAKKPKPKSYSISSSNSFSIDGAGNIIDEKSSYSDSRDQPQGGPSLTPHPGTLMGWGGASHETKAPDQLSSQGDTRMDSIKNSISNITQGAKNMFMKGTTIGRAAGAAGGFITKMLGKVQPAAEGSQYSKQDINSLTNQVIEGNEAFMTQKTQMNVQVGASTEQDGQAAMLAAIAKMSKTSLGINEGDPVPSAALIPSKHLLHSITIVDGGKTPHDIA